MASATLKKLPFKQDVDIYTEMDWYDDLLFTFYEDVAQTQEVNFSTSTFTGEVLDKPGGTSVATLSFNTPANDGVISPRLTDTQTAALSGTTNHYYVYVTNASGIKTPYFSGRIKISDDFKAGS